MSTETKPKHIGRNIGRIRELRGMKQEALAQAIGTNQQAISGIEGSETIDETKLANIAEALGVTVEAIKSFQKKMCLIILILLMNLFQTVILGIIMFVTSILLIKLWNFTSVWFRLKKTKMNI